MSVRIFSSRQELDEIASFLIGYNRMPFTPINIPGAVLEAVLAHVRGGQVLRTYDFVDVVNSEEGLGWQVKSTLAATPVTWKRAKIPDANRLIDESRRSRAGLKALGDAIITFCNRHVQESIQLYDLRAIVYSRLVIEGNGRATYFERRLCTRRRPQAFDPEVFEWRWSDPKTVVKKEQLQALHGYNRVTKRKWFAWHGLGENQLHFSGERDWWPSARSQRRVDLHLAQDDDKLSMDAFVELLAQASKSG